MEFEIRKAGAADATALADFIVDLKHFRRIEGVPREVVRQRMSGLMEQVCANNSHTLYVAEDKEGSLLGYTNVHWLPYLFLAGPEGYVSELFIAQAARGQAVGSRLLQAVKEEARSRGCSRLSLLNMRDRESYQRGFYAKDGWEERPDAANFVFELPREQPR
jgi:GNAT superfamily N-acetyltransferase